MEKPIYVISRPVEGVTLNGKEYLLDADQNLMEFESRQAALDFLDADEDELEELGVDVELYNEQEDAGS